MANKKVYAATGKRKRSVAQVKLTSGSGKITVNGVDVHEYMPYEYLVLDLMQPLVITENQDKLDVTVKVRGGGFSGQAGAIRLGIARALLIYDENSDPTAEDSYRKKLKTAGMMTRDARIKERKQYGLKKARKAPQFSKR